LKTQTEILHKLGIEALNQMQDDAALAIENSEEIILLSPTGTGKTLAFLLPLLQLLDQNSKEVQALILVPSRELALQIEQVFRDMGSGFKANAVYGGRPIAKDKEELKHAPALLIGTPGRVMDHLQRGTVSSKKIKYLILDEFDKSLEVGFEEQMKEIISMLGFINLIKKIYKILLINFFHLKMIF
jgi:superfamily II DNA/RNA helicase